MPKVRNWTFNALGLQHSMLKVGDPKSSAIGLQLLVSKVETWDSFSNDIFFEISFCAKKLLEKKNWKLNKLNWEGNYLLQVFNNAWMLSSPYLSLDPRCKNWGPRNIH